MVEKLNETLILEKILAGTHTWSEVTPQWRFIWYEGAHFEAFALEMMDKFGFDPRRDCMYCFHCPANVLDEIYGNDEYPLGS